jgi:hypothetical protein
MDHAEKEELIDYFAFREIALATGRITLLVGVWLLLKSLGISPALTSRFIFVAASVLMTGQLGKRMD